MNPAPPAAENYRMAIPDEELFRRLRDAERLSKARSKSAPPDDHVADSLGFQLAELGLEAVKTFLTRAAVVAGIVTLVVMWFQLN